MRMGCIYRLLHTDWFENQVVINKSIKRHSFLRIILLNYHNIILSHWNPSKNNFVLVRYKPEPYHFPGLKGTIVPPYAPSGAPLNSRQVSRGYSAVQIVIPTTSIRNDLLYLSCLIYQQMGNSCYYKPLWKFMPFHKWKTWNWNSFTYEIFIPHVKSKGFRIWNT